MKAAKTTRAVVRIENGSVRNIEDTIVTEQAITLKINGEELVTMVCTPEYIEELAIGYMAAEGVIRRHQDIRRFRIDDRGFVHIELEQINPLFASLQHKRYVTSCCGMSRQGFVFANDALTAKKQRHVHTRLTPEQCGHLMNELQRHAALFHETGGVHNAALCEPDRVLITRTDIGRHNALDKIYGHCLKNSWDMKGKILAFSGRISSEILLKAAKIGCEIVLSKSAPTEFALQAAEDLGITTVGFIRDGSMNIYTGSERILLPDS